MCYIKERARLRLVVQGQAERNVVTKTKKQYLSKCKVLTNILNKDEDIRKEALVTNEDGEAIKHTGEAKDIYVMKLPIDVAVAKLLFAAISIDEDLPKRGNKRKRRDEIITEGEVEATSSDHVEVDSQYDMNPGKDKVTVSAQAYQNYKSALRWWHQYDCPSMGKVGYPWPGDVDMALCASIATYKRDVGSKKRNGIMKSREGKSAFNLHGYKAICRYFKKMKPTKKGQSWHEGIFASLFTTKSVSTIGRSDNVDDVITTNMDWSNDAMTIKFGTTKTDQAGTMTSDIKRIYANPFAPEICPLLDLAVYVFCIHRTSVEDAKYLFAGNDQNKRYYSLLVDAVRNGIDKSLDLGCAREDIGTHSNRKFAESTSVSKLDGPSRTQVCLRAGQGVGGTQDCYMLYDT